MADDLTRPLGEANAQGFQEVNIKATGSSEPMAEEADILENEEYSLWRMNLTALSQTSNLYFIAASANINIYQPNYPTQAMHVNNPLLTLHPPVSAPNLQGYLAPERGHAINQLIVGNLGSQEIVACVCDDGDVYAYSIQSIINGIDRMRQQPGVSAADDIRPFFHENVDQSAWGLAIHREARLIAVSANTHKITVFPFGLEEAQDTGEAGPPLTEGANGRFYRRDVNHRLILAHHRKNIPSIGFSPCGKWLVSTDIETRLVVWNVWEQRPCYTAILTNGRNAQGMGWMSILLDPSAFRNASSPLEMYGEHSEFSGEINDAEWHPGKTKYMIAATREDRTNKALYQTRLTQTRLVDSSFRFLNQTGDLSEEVYLFPPNFPILHTDTKNIRLLDCAISRYGMRAGYFSIAQVLSNPLLDMPQIPGAVMHGMDRLNMVVQIPELGVVVVGSQLGRAVVLSLTKAASKKTYAGDQRMESDRPATLGFRLDFRLPFKSQRGQSWEVSPLHGLAAGPIQGRECTDLLDDHEETWRRFETTRRYRLFLHFHSGATLTYELSRNDDEVRVSEGRGSMPLI